MHLRKNLLTALILFILATTCSNFTHAYIKPLTKTEGKITSIALNDFLNQRNSQFVPYDVYEPKDIDLRDAAYHSSYDRLRLHTEWWFFEGIFDNGYSTAFFILIFSKEKTFSNESLGTCVFWFSLYKDTDLKFFSIKEFPFESLTASEDFPLIRISDDENSIFMGLDQEGYKNKQWIFNVSFKINDQGTNLTSNLTFTGTTKGYAGEILRGWYGPILPKASVEGTLTLNDEEIDVGGLGYLEHGWDIPLPVWQYGWFFGKIVSDSFCLMWGRMMQTRWNEQGRVAILSKDGGGYIAINPKNFTFTPTNYRFNNWELIPTKFFFNISDPGISINVTMETVNIHHFTALAGLSHCWRYHVNVNGQITYGDTTEIIKDKIQIMGIMRFR